MSSESKRTGLFKDKKDQKKVRKSTDMIPDAAASGHGPCQLCSERSVLVVSFSLA